MSPGPTIGERRSAGELLAGEQPPTSRPRIMNYIKEKSGLVQYAKVSTEEPTSKYIMAIHREGLHPPPGVITHNQQLPVTLHTSDEPTETEDRVELLHALEKPVLDEATEEHPLHLVSEGMSTEMKAMKDFGVYEEVAVDTLPESQVREALPTMWVKVPKAEKLRRRLVAKGFYQEVTNSDDIYASTPLLASLKILLIIALVFGYSIGFADISTAFLHATLDENIYVWPPCEFYPKGTTLWKLKKAMYGLRQAPRRWQEHFATTMKDMGGLPLKSEPNVYYFKDRKLWVLCYVDDLIVIGPTKAVDDFYNELSGKLLVKVLGKLTPGATQDFLGRKLRRTVSGVEIYPEKSYLQNIYELLGLTTAKAVTTTGTKSTKMPFGCSTVDAERHRIYRTAVGKLLWLCPIRPDLAYAVKELARHVGAPTEEDWLRLRHAVKYLKGTEDYVYKLEPRSSTPSSSTSPLLLEVYADSDWAGCPETRKSTTGVAVLLNGSVIHHYSRTQSTIAHSSAEAELYALCSATMEGIATLQFLRESCLPTQHYIDVFTDSTAGKTICSRFGTTRQTKHIDLRFLYIQDLVRLASVRLHKVSTEQNYADLCTKFLDATRLTYCLRSSSYSHFA